MPSPRTIELVKATVPALQAHGLALTTHFYDRLFSNEPELKNIFNLATRPAASKQQAWRTPCSHMPETSRTRRRWAPGRVAHRAQAREHRHPADHYPIVGRHLLGVDPRVLGEAATDEIIAAWAEAYGELAPRADRGRDRL